MNLSARARFREAAEAYARGDLDAAEAAFRRLLAVAPEHAASLNALGAVVCRRGRIDEGLALFRRAVALAPQSAEYHLNLGQALASSGRFGEASAAQARAAALDPRSAAARLGLAASLHRLGRLGDAESAFRAALALEPENAVGWNDLGSVLMAQRRLAEAEAALRRAIDQRPWYAEAHVNLAALFMARERPADAAAACRQAIVAKPDLAAAHCNLGVALRRLDRFDEAEAACRRAIALDPDMADAHNNLGVVLHDRKRPVQSVAAFRRAVALRGDFAQAHCDLGIALLRLGELDEGAAEYDWHYVLQPPPLAESGRPRWDGQPLPGRTILLHADQGFGDAIQFVRYAPQVRERCGRVVLACRRPLVRLLRSAAGVDSVVCDADPLPDFDGYAPMVGLLHALRARLDTIPARIPYLAADTAAAERLAPELFKGTGLRVGLAWAGSPTNWNDRHRSVPFASLMPLLEVAGVDFVSLEVGERAIDAAALAPGRVLDLCGRLGDFADTAAVMNRLDLVIAVDTAVAHLAGALGKPVWVLLSYVCDWRYFMDRSDSPWYPTMRLFRQHERGEWAPVVAEVFEALQRFAAAHGGSAPPPAGRFRWSAGDAFSNAPMSDS